MNVKIHRPRLLIAALLVVLGISSAAVIWADELTPRRKETPVFPAIPVSQEVTSEEQRKAVGIIEESRIVKVVSGSQEWTATQGTVKKIGGKTVVKLYASWKNPATSSGPWTSAACRGTRKTVVHSEISNIRKLAVWVDLDAEKVVANVPGAAAPGETGPIETPLQEDQKVLVYDARTDELIYEGDYGDLGKVCPGGSEDD